MFEFGNIQESVLPKILYLFEAIRSYIKSLIGKGISQNTLSDLQTPFKPIKIFNAAEDLEYSILF